METKRVPVSETLKEEAAWVRRVYGFRGQIVKILTAGSIKKVEQNFVSKSSQQAVRTRELLITLGARAYELDQGKPPPDSAALVPGYLKVVPKDPNSGTGMKLPR
jgi:hypothetical protein